MSDVPARFPLRAAVVDAALTSRADGHELVVDGCRLRLGLLEARLLTLCDGTRSVPVIATLLERELGTPVGAESVWRALDGLADLGLLAERVTPPASPARFDRRGFLKRAWPGVAVAGAAAMPGLVFAAEQQEQSSKLGTESEAKAAAEANNKLTAEQNNKLTAEQNNKVTAEQNNKVTAEQNNKLTAEQNNKASVQEQESKSSAQEQANKLTAQEQDDKVAEMANKAGESDQKLSAVEQDEKASLVQERDSKVAAEQSAKAGQPGGGSTSPVSEPVSVALFGAALAALAASRYRETPPDDSRGE